MQGSVAAHDDVMSDRVIGMEKNGEGARAEGRGEIWRAFYL